MSHPNTERDERVSQTHGFAPMDSLSDVCGAYTSDGYCWRPRRHPVHGAGAGMGLYECDTPAQGFNAEREKKVAERAATRMRDRCVKRMLAQADEWEALWKADLTGEHSDKFLLAQTARELADSLQSLTLEVEEKR